MKLIIKVPNNTIELDILEEIPLLESSNKKPCFLYQGNHPTCNTLSTMLSYHGVKEFDNELFERGSIYMLRLHNVESINRENETITVNI